MYLPGNDIPVRPAEPDLIAQNKMTKIFDDIAVETFEEIVDTPIYDTANNMADSTRLNVTIETTGMTDTKEATDSSIDGAAGINYFYPYKRNHFPTTQLISLFTWSKRSNVPAPNSQGITPTAISIPDDYSINRWANPQPILIPP